LIFVLSGNLENKNLKRKLPANRRNVKIFQSGKIFTTAGTESTEENKIGVILCVLRACGGEYFLKNGKLLLAQSNL